ncbi:histidine phosphotransferase family protein [Alisedimentitalea sp. MJ-SS2]|uniref:histidine phosphotransferase family protein n=1 Tax=Aliisedimentitalea sp. MJ-SS2 TaxID=3049795 RepID=UPI002915B830|nr:histidine phosphotransferase family protein [Alisedimentitalea sp. MJ-SS2]MDU8926986.1 histidine phosphotransferase family protein [Alisedimentitalea sp. MJ-SS2]
MTQSPLTIATLVGSRICHDLISPVGAIHNGIELISIAGPIDSPELTLIADSVTNAASRIKFFRVAFGNTVGEQMVGAPEAAKTAADAFAGGRSAVNWQANGDLPRAEVQAAYLAVLCIESALHRGGTITVTGDDHGIRVTGEGGRVACEPELWQPLATGEVPEGLRPAHVQFALLVMAVAELGRTLSTATRETDVSISF